MRKIFALIFLVFFFFFLSPRVYAGTCSIELKYNPPLVSSSVIDVEVAPSTIDAKYLGCKYRVKQNGKKQESTFTLGPNLDPGKYVITATPAIRTNFSEDPENFICGECKAEFEVQAGTQGLNCFSCPNNYFYSFTDQECIKKGETKWQNSNPAPIPNCLGECNTTTNVCEGKPIQPSNNCCEPNYAFSSNSKVCEQKEGVGGHTQSLCSNGLGCNATTQQCEAGGIAPIAPAPITAAPTPIVHTKLPCAKIANGNKCLAVDTALGEIDTDPAAFIKKMFGILVSLAGGVAVLLIMTAGYRLMTSSGDPEKVKGAQETLTSAIVGLLFVLFSLVILEIIGVDLLRIPGFGP